MERVRPTYVFEYNIVSRYPIRCHKEEEVWVRSRVDVPDLAFGEQLQVAQITVYQR